MGLFCSLQYDVSNLSITLHYITLRCSHLPLAHYCSFAPRHVLTAPGPCFLVHSAGTSLAFTLHHMTSYYIVIALRRGVRSEAQLSSTETRSQKCSQSGKNGSKHPMLSISMAFNVISCKKSKETLKNSKLLILQCKFGSRAQK